MWGYIVVAGATLAALLLTKKDQPEQTRPKYDPPPMPKQPPMPGGFRQWPFTRKVSAVAQRLAGGQLNVLSMGGYATATDEDGQTIAAWKQYHLDDHVANPDGSGLPWWHPGISLLVKS